MNQLTQEEVRIIFDYYSADSKDQLFLKVPHHLTNREILLACKAYDNVPLSMATHKNVTFKPIENTSQIRITIDDCNYSYRFDSSNGAIAVFKDGDFVWPRDTQLFLAQYYFKERIACPLFFTHGHWANGLTAIDLGIAVPSRDRLFDALKTAYNNDKDEIQKWFHEQVIYNNVNLFDLKTLDAKIAEVKDAIIVR